MTARCFIRFSDLVNVLAIKSSILFVSLKLPSHDHTFIELSSFEEEDYESGCHGDEYILNSTTNGNISLSQGNLNKHKQCSEQFC